MAGTHYIEIPVISFLTLVASMSFVVISVMTKGTYISFSSEDFLQVLRGYRYTVMASTHHRFTQLSFGFYYTHEYKAVYYVFTIVLLNIRR